MTFINLSVTSSNYLTVRAVCSPVLDCLCVCIRFSDLVFIHKQFMYMSLYNGLFLPGTGLDSFTSSSCRFRLSRGRGSATIRPVTCNYNLLPHVEGK